MGEQKSNYEEFKVSSNEAVGKVRKLIAEGNVRRVYLKNSEGKTLFQLPLTAGVAATAVTALISPAIIAIGAVAALLTQVTIGVERDPKKTKDSADTIQGEIHTPGNPASDDRSAQ